MRRTIMIMAAAIMMSTVTMAQRNDSTKVRKLDKSEMIKKRTEATSKRYGLNEEQSARLLELNTRYADSLRMAGPQRGDSRMQVFSRQGSKPQVKRDTTLTREKMRPGHQRMQTGNRRGEMPMAMKNYNAELKTIMTEEQYQKYTEDMQRQRPTRNGQRGGNRPGTRPAAEQ